MFSSNIKLNLNKKNIFLLDGIGAFFSAMFTGVLLPLFSDRLGLPTQILQYMALLPLVYGIYSLNCYWLNEIKPWMLLGIITANLIYIFISAVLIIIIDGLTIWGRALLIAEILVILAVIALEIKIYRNAFSDKTI